MKMCNIPQTPKNRMTEHFDDRLSLGNQPKWRIMLYLIGDAFRVPFWRTQQQDLRGDKVYYACWECGCRTATPATYGDATATALCADHAPRGTE